MNKIAKILFASMLVASLFTGVISASAAKTGSRVPEHMTPGTVIKYDSDNQMHVVTAGDSSVKNVDTMDVIHALFTTRYDGLI